MAKIEITKTELVWPGKYNEDGTRRDVPRVNLPFQVIETINESRATRESKKAPQQNALFDIYRGTEGETFEDGWKNKLIWGDNLLVMSSLLQKFAGKIDLIYIDPPFATGADFSFEAIVGEETFSLFVHLDWHVGHYMKVILDEIFGEHNFRNEIVWHYPGREMHISTKFNAKHDTILFYAKSEMTSIRMANVAVPYKREERLKGLRRKVHKDKDGREWVWETRGQSSGQEPYKRYVDEIISQGKPLSDVWDDLQFLRGNHPERVDYPTQKPSWLVERIVKAATDEGQLVADFFAGSGTTAVAAETAGRRWIVSDLSRYAIHTVRKRMLEID